MNSRPWLQAVQIVALVLLVQGFLPSVAWSDLPVGTASTATATPGEPATVVIWNRPVVELRAKIGSLTPEARARNIEQKFRALTYEELSAEPRSVASTVGDLSGYWIFVGERALLALLPEDLDPESELTLQQYANQTVIRVRAALKARADQRRTPVLIRGALLSALATGLFVVSLWAVAWLRSRTLKRMRIRLTQRPLEIRGVNVRPFLRAIEESLVKLTVIGAALIVSYLWLTFVLLQFPYSHPWGEGLGNWLRELLGKLGGGALQAVPGFFTVLIIFVVTRLIVQGVDRFFRSVESGWLKVHWLEADTARATRRLAIILIWVFALTVAYPYIPGSSSDAFKGISVFVGLMVSLGSAGFVNQIMSGLVIVYSRSIKPGEFVQVGDTQGKVTEIGVLATKVLTPTRQEITIPNAALVGSSITNFSRHTDAEHGSIVGTTITIGYDTPWRQVHAMLELAAERTPHLRREPKPRILQRALSDFYVEYQMLFSIDKPEDQRAVLSDLHASIQDVFNEHGVQIMSPNFVAQPNEKIYVPKDAWFTPPTPAETELEQAAPVSSGVSGRTPLAST